MNFQMKWKDEKLLNILFPLMVFFKNLCDVIRVQKFI